MAEFQFILQKLTENVLKSPKYRSLQEIGDVLEI